MIFIVNAFHHNLIHANVVVVVVLHGVLVAVYLGVHVVVVMAVTETIVAVYSGQENLWLILHHVYMELLQDA